MLFVSTTLCLVFGAQTDNWVLPHIERFAARSAAEGGNLLDIHKIYDNMKALKNDGKSGAELFEGEKNGSSIVVKMISKAPTTIDGLRLEVATMDRLQGHPHIVEFLDGREDKEQLFLVLPKYEGGDLGDFVCERGYIANTDPRYLFSIMKQMLLAVEYVHEKNIVHCDIKKTNFMLKDKHRTIVVLIDFGFAKILRSGNKDGALMRQRDVWDLGKTIFQIVLGDHEPHSEAVTKKLGEECSEDELLRRLNNGESSTWFQSKRESLNIEHDKYFYDFLQLIFVGDAERPTVAELRESKEFQILEERYGKSARLSAAAGASGSARKSAAEEAPQAIVLDALLPLPELKRLDNVVVVKTKDNKKGNKGFVTEVFENCGFMVQFNKEDLEDVSFYQRNELRKTN